MAFPKDPRHVEAHSHIGMHNYPELGMDRHVQAAAFVLNTFAVGVPLA
jgi:hypothetical protein